ncbi:unnamed protein product, partial [Ectocarpus fasciculatus]
VAGGLTATYRTPASSHCKTKDDIAEILTGVRAIQSDLGITQEPRVDPVGNFPIITNQHRSLTVKALRANPEIYANLCNKKTPMGFTFDHAIQAGVDAPHLGVGIVAGEAAAYDTFKEVMDIVIDGWHGYKPTDTHQSDMDYTKLKLDDALAAKFDKYVISTRIRSGRSIEGLALPPSTDRKQRRKVESLVVGALGGLQGDLAGKYYPLGGMTKQEEQQLIDDHFLFQKPTGNNVLANCGAARDWPDARGIFHNKEKTFLVWVNEEDHIRCISMQMGGNVKEVFARWARAINAIEGSLTNAGYGYSHTDHHGYITTCPSNIGTGLRGSVMLKIPKLYKKLGVHEVEALCDSMGLQARGSKGEHSPPGPQGEFDISNKGRIGASEVELVQRMIDGVKKLIEMEEACK